MNRGFDTDRLAVVGTKHHYYVYSSVCAPSQLAWSNPNLPIFHKSTRISVYIAAARDSPSSPESKLVSWALKQAIYDAWPELTGSQPVVNPSHALCKSAVISLASNSCQCGNLFRFLSRLLHGIIEYSYRLYRGCELKDTVLCSPKKLLAREGRGATQHALAHG